MSVPAYGDKHPRDDLFWNGFEYVREDLIKSEQQQEASEGIMAGSEDEHQQAMALLTDEERRALSNQVHATFSNPNATSADVLEAFIGYMTLNSQYFYTASGELGVHLSAAVDSLRNTQQPKRRFLGMPQEG